MRAAILARRLPTFLAMALALARVSSPAGGNDPLTIVVSVFPLYDLTRCVAGERAEVVLLIPSGSDVHTWQPRPGDIVRFSRADLFIYIGSGLEPWADALLKARRGNSGRSLKAGDGLTTLGRENDAHGREGAAGVDPHIWLDFEKDETIVHRIRDALEAIDPAGSKYFRRNAAAVVESLRRLDEDFRTGLKDCRSKTLVLGGHAAFGYLAARYGLEQVSLYGLSPDAEPSPRHLGRLVKLVRDRGLKHIFYEENVGRKMADVLAREAEVGLLPLNPGHTPTRNQLEAGISFLAIMRRNLANLKRGLGCE